MASLTFSPTTLHIVLSSLNLLQYEDALIKAGYDYLNCFDTENNTIEELSQELTNDVPMKKPHARKLTRYLFSQQHQHLISAPAAQDVNDGALPIADTIPMPRVLNNTTPSVDPTVPSVDPTVDPQLMGKEMRDQIERDYNSKAAKERAVLVEEHAQKEAAVVKEKAAKKELALLKESFLLQEAKEDSASVETQLTPPAVTTKCISCGIDKPKNEYSSNQWKKKRHQNKAKCKICSTSTRDMAPNGESKESSLSPCPEGALRVKPGLNSLSNAVKEAKK